MVSIIRQGENAARKWANRWSAFWGAGSRRAVLALMDQAVVSGTRFATTVILGRIAGAEQLGAYSLAFTFVVLSSVVQDAIVSLPYTVHWARRRGARRRAIHAGSTLLWHVVFAVGASMLLAGISLIVLAMANQALLGRAMAMLAICLPGVLFWEFARRLGFAHLRVRAVLVLDAASSALFLGTLATLAAFDQLTAATAIMVMGGTFGISTLGWLKVYGQPFLARRRRARIEGIRNWRFGRWILASETSLLARGYAIPWVVATLLGTAATGHFAAYLTLILFANPLLNGISNILAPDLALAHAREGQSEVRRLVRKVTIVLAAIMVLLCIAVGVFGELAVSVLFGPEFTGHALCAVVLAVGVFGESFGMPSYNGLWAVGRADWCCRASVIGLVVSLSTAVFLIPFIGLAGAAAGMCLGKWSAAAIQWALFWRLPPEEARP